MCETQRERADGRQTCGGAAGPYVGLVGRDVLLLLWHVVPIHPRPGFDFLPHQTGDAGQLHGLAEDRLRRRRHVHAHGTAHRR